MIVKYTCGCREIDTRFFGAWKTCKQHEQEAKREAKRYAREGEATFQ